MHQLMCCRSLFECLLAVAPDLSGRVFYCGIPSERGVTLYLLVTPAMFSYVSACGRYKHQILLDFSPHRGYQCFRVDVINDRQHAVVYPTLPSVYRENLHRLRLPVVCSEVVCR